MAAEARARMLRIALLVFALELGLGLLLFNLYRTFFLSPDGLAQLDIIAYYAGGVSALEGEFEVESRVGTSVTITLPISQADGAAAESRQQIQAESPVSPCIPETSGAKA